jgi:cyclic pyranopterin phosphate synthase
LPTSPGTTAWPKCSPWVEAARCFSTIKLNCVLMRGVNADEVGALVDFAAERDLSLRFTEVMRTNDNPDFYAQRHVGAELVTSLLDGRGWSRLPRRAGDGPAIEYGRSDARGRVGVIAPFRAISVRPAIACACLRAGSCLCLFEDAGSTCGPCSRATATSMTTSSPACARSP